MPRTSFHALPRVSTALLLAAAAMTTASSAGAAAFTQIAAGLDHSCGLRSDATVACWGNGLSGQLGLIGVDSSKVPAAVIGSYETTQISSGQGYWCERLADSSVLCTGLNAHGQLGDGNTVTVDYPQRVSGVTTASTVSAGARTACAITGGGVVCWGDGSRGQLGNGVISDGPQPTPVVVQNLNGVTNMAVGNTSACAVRKDTLVYCWGDTSNGQLGNDLSSAITRPGVPVTGLSGASSVAVGDRHACALKSNGTVWCWGDSSSGQLGDGEFGVRADAEPVPGLTGITQISANALTTCAVTSKGNVLCWGSGLKGQLGNGAAFDSAVPVQAVGITDAAQVSVGVAHTCVVSQAQVPSCWGSNNLSQLGTGGPTGPGASSTVPQTVVDSLRPVVLLRPASAGLRGSSSSGGAVQFRDFKIAQTGQFCPAAKVSLTVTAKGRTVSHSTRFSRLNGKCTLNGTYQLAQKTLGATAATYTVRARGAVTRQGALTLLPTA